MESLQRLSENVVLLGAINQFPIKPTEIAVQDIPAEEGGLSSQLERHFADQLAYLAATNDDSTKVVAVCIEQRPAEAAMTIRIACNTGLSAEFKNAFSQLIEEIENVAKVGRHGSRRTQIASLLQRIVELDYWRILSRLRSIHAKKSRKVQRNPARPKPAMPILLADTLHQAQRFTKPISFQQQFQGVTEEAGELVVCFEKLEASTAHRSQCEALISVLNVTKRIISTYKDLENIIKYPKADPSTIASLPGALGKLARYVDIAEDLTAIARGGQYSMFANISIDVLTHVSIPSAISSHRTNTLHEAFEHFHHRTKGSPTTAHILASLSTRNLLHPAQMGFARMQQNSSCHSKVHAEIQLLCFYQLHADLNQPKWICASKSACYLCHIFVQSHGVYQVPRTHGRVYGTWILPAELRASLGNGSTRFSEAISRMNSQLEKDILKSVTQKKGIYLQPNESVIPLRVRLSPTSTFLSTKPTSLVSEHHFQTTDSLNVKQESDVTSSDLIVPNATASCKASIKSHVIDHTFHKHCIQDGPHSPISNSSTETMPAKDQAFARIFHLLRGQPLRERLPVASGEIVVIMPKLKLYIVPPVSSTSSHDTSASNDWVVDICWLEVSIDVTKSFSDFEILDVAHLTSAENIGEAGAACSDKVLIIRKKDTYASLKFNRE